MNDDLDWLERDPAVILATPTYVETPLGSLLLLACSEGLLLCDFIERSESLLGWMARNLVRPQPGRSGDQAVLAQAQHYLRAYFARGPREAQKEVPLPPLSLRGTDFQDAVWRRLLQVPPGATITYAALARELGRSAYSNAVARAVWGNPLAIFIPCHRVLFQSEAQLAGYPGLSRKAWLISHEQQEEEEEVIVSDERLSLAPLHDFVPLPRPADPPPTPTVA